VKEEWRNLPNSVREEIHRREREFATRIQQTTEDSKFGATMQEVLRPFEAVMSMEANNPFQAVQNLARAASILRMGAPQQKAQFVAQLTKDYGIDVEMLDSALAGEEPDPESQKLDQMLNQRLKPIQEMFQEISQTRESLRNRQNTTYQQEVEAFAANKKNEFFDEVRDDMADLIEIRAKRKENLSLQDAYNIAVQARPDLQEILSKRKKAQSVRDAARRAAEKKSAATSVASSSPSRSSPNAPEGDDLRADLEHAWSNAESG
jgi:hypothetical protein